MSKQLIFLFFDSVNQIFKKDETSKYVKEVSMRIILQEKPQKPIIIQGFPGFGLIGTIVTEYLIEHLQAKKIGSIKIEEGSPVVAVQNGVVIEPVGIYYCEKYNIVLVHTVQNLQELEWKYAHLLKEVVTQLHAWELLSIEGVVDQSTQEESQIFYFTTTPEISQKLEQAHVSPLQNGILMGTGAALICEELSCHYTAIFTTTHSQLPDSRAAASVIKALDAYLQLDIPYEPLLEKAKEFEEKYASLGEKVKMSKDELSKKNLNYVG